MGGGAVIVAHNCAGCRCNRAASTTDGRTTLYTCTACGKTEKHTKKAHKPRKAPQGTRSGVIDAARSLKANQTLPERILGKALAEKYGPDLFLAQWAVSEFVLDFWCPLFSIAIEVDGDSHTRAATMARDELQERAVAEIGGVTLRFSNQEVLENGVRVETAIYRAVTEAVRGWDRLPKARVAAHGWRMPKRLRKELLAGAGTGS